MFLKETTEELYVRTININMFEFFTSSIKELLFVVDGGRKEERGKTMTRTNTTNKVRAFKESTEKETVL